MKQKAFFIIFKGLSMKQIIQFFLEGEGLTLIEVEHSAASMQNAINYLISNCRNTTNFFE